MGSHKFRVFKYINANNAPAKNVLIAAISENPGFIEWANIKSKLDIISEVVSENRIFNDCKISPLKIISSRNAAINKEKIWNSNRFDTVGGSSILTWFKKYATAKTIMNGKNE